MNPHQYPNARYAISYPMLPVWPPPLSRWLPDEALGATQLGVRIIVEFEGQNYVVHVVARINLLLFLLIHGLPVLYYIRSQVSAGRFLCHFVFATAHL